MRAMRFFSHPPKISQASQPHPHGIGMLRRQVPAYRQLDRASVQVKRLIRRA
jgi:hypothetical protein